MFVALGGPSTFPSTAGRSHLIDQHATLGSLSDWERDGVRGFGAEASYLVPVSPHPGPLPAGEREKTCRAGGQSYAMTLPRKGGWSCLLHLIMPVRHHCNQAH